MSDKEHKLIDKDDYEDVLFQHDFQRDLILSCLKLVENYIRENKLILVGGMAIDYALQTKGKKLYSKNKLPDYDFYSPKFHLDAYKIGELVSKLTPGVSVIRGLHASTMRVRVNFIPVADVTYMPPTIFDRVPTFNHQGLTIAHPFFLMIDQHRALSLPFENPPKETIVGRWKKDILRLDMMQSEFKLGITKMKNCSIDCKSYEPVKIKLRKVSISKKVLLGNCLSGYIAILYWLDKAINDKLIDKDDVIELGSIKIKGDHIEASIPDDQFITIVSDDYEKTIVNIKDNQHADKNIDSNSIQYYNAITDKIPRRVQIGDYEIIDNKGRLLSVHIDGKYTISCMQDILNYTLTWSVLTQERRSSINAYIACVKTLNLAAKHALNKDSFNVYLPNVNSIYGDSNWSESFLLQLEDANEALNGSIRDKNIKTIIKTPKNAYFDNGKKLTEEHLSFNIQASPLYNYDGSTCGKFTPRELP